MKKALIVPCSKEFFPGLSVMDYSLQKHNPWIKSVPRIILSNSIDSFRDWEVRRIDESQYEEVFRNTINLRHKEAWFRLEALRMEEFDLLLVMGADFLCMGDISKLFEETDFDMRAAPDLGIKKLGDFYAPHFPRINSDLIIFGKRMVQQSSFEAVMHRAIKYICRDDQVALNDFIAAGNASIEYLSPKYNLLKRVPFHRPELWNELKDDIRILHYVGHKPWNKNPRRGDDANPKIQELDSLWLSAEEDMRNRSL